ncbi:MAG: MFS transporter [Geodermatophilaceae bacterium]|nr:MFS transporter [Geodermatophilaceae bacterium]
MDPADGTAAPDAEPVVAGTLRGCLARPDFRRLFAVRLSAQWADGVFQSSLAGAVLFNPERAATASDVAAALAVLLLPYSLLGPFAGVLIDRWSRQRVLLGSNLLRCALLVVVALLLGVGVAGAPFYLTALAVIAVNRFFLAALAASLPHVTATENLVFANALTTTLGTVAAVTGGTCGVILGVLVGAGGQGYALIALSAGLGYATSAVLAGGFPRLHLGPDAADRRDRSSAAHILTGLIAGARHIRSHRPALAALSVIGAHRFLFGLATVSTILLYRNYFQSSGPFRAGLAGLTQVVVAAALGAVLAAAVTPAAVRAVGKPRWIIGTLAVAALSQLCLVAPYRMATVLPAALLIGFVAQAVKICVDTIVQETIDDAYRGRVFSVYDTVFNVGFVAAAALAALALPPDGKSYWVLGVIVAGYALTAVGYARTSRAR